MNHKIISVAVVGLGTMGQSIAQVCAAGGYLTKIYDVNSSLPYKAIDNISHALTDLVAKGKVTELAKAGTIGRLSVATQLTDLQADLVIEAVVEKLEVKQNLFLALEAINQGKAILATNTSSIPVTEIASKLKYPQQCMGLHFFNPATLMKLVEVISGMGTSREVADQVKTFAISLQKTPVMVKDSPGFIVNRVARHYYVEALKLLEEGVASHEQVDQLLRSAGFKMGPFELIDLIGIDVNFAVTSSLYHSFHQEPRFRPSRVQEQKVMAQHLGRKTGKGFYEY